GALFTKGSLESGIQPFRIIPCHVDWRAFESRLDKQRPFGFGKRGRSKTRAVEEPGDLIRGHAALETHHAEQNGARRILAHDEGGRCSPAQSIVDETGNGSPVAGPGEAMRQTPVLQRIGCRAPARTYVGKHLNRGGNASTWRHRHTASSTRTI